MIIKKNVTFIVHDLNVGRSVKMELMNTVHSFIFVSTNICGS